ncbi:hypothetical protein P7C73_g1726, partial [Tremellales sp. Uapishka_1]
MDGAQSILAGSASNQKAHPAPFLLRHTLLLLPILVGISLLIFTLRVVLPVVYRSIKNRFFAKPYQPIALEDDDEVEPPSPPPAMPSGGLTADFKAHIRSLRDFGSWLFALELLRTACLCALLGISIYAAIRAESPEKTTGSLVDMDILKKHKHKHNKGRKHNKSTVDDYSSLEWSEFGVCGFYAYTVMITSLLLTLRPLSPLRRHISFHVDVLLMIAFALYAYRDIYPLLTYFLNPSDVNEWTTWVRVGILGLAGVIIPFIRPRTYVPVNPLRPTPEKDVHPEQTASLFSYLFYNYMTGLVLTAWKTPALAYNDMHPMADYDGAEYLYDAHIEKLDPVRRRNKGLKPRHLWKSLAAVYWKEIIIICAMTVISAVMELSGPVGINKLLQYLETNGEGATFRPIVWIGVLFVGPVLGSLAIQYYIFTTTRSLVRAEALLTQVLFDHALRLRMKDATEDETKAEIAEGPTIVVEEVLEHTPVVLVEGGADSSDSTEVASSAGSSKDKDKKADQKAAADLEAKKAKSQGIAGKINVLMAADLENVINGRDLALVFVFTPIQVMLSVFVLYRILSWSSIIGMFIMLITLPVPGMLTKWSAGYQERRMLATDSRIDTITEAIGAIRIIKMFGWESRIKDRISAKREEEIGLIWKRRLMMLGTEMLSGALPILTMVVTFAMYTLVQKRELTASTVFTSMTVFESLKGVMGMCFYLINEFVTASVSLKRLNAFFQESEMIDAWTEGTTASISTPAQLEAESEDLIRIHDAVFTWGSETDAASANFSLQIPDVTFVKGKINIIAGPTGSGKSSLLQALIGELHFEQKEGSFFHLPRTGGVSYAAQESWCMSESIKDNILFGEPFEEDRYKKVIYGCGLETDLTLFEDGDSTEVGEKGVTLSGGQKARITLARAIYSKTDVVLLDDGSVKSAGPIEDDDMIEEEVEEERVEEQKAAEVIPNANVKPEEKKAVNKLIKDEEKGEGRISKKAMFSFLSNFGGPIFWFIYFGSMIFAYGASAFQNYWLGIWARAYASADDWRQVSALYYLGLYVGLVVIGIVTLSGAQSLYFIGAIRASRAIHKNLVDHILGGNFGSRRDDEQTSILERRQHYNLNRWVTVRIDMIGAAFAASLAVVVRHPVAAEVKLVANSYFCHRVRTVNQLEVSGNSVERIEDYLVIDQEPKDVTEKQPPASWPTSGSIVLSKLSAKYSEDGPTVLKDLDVVISSGEKVGIVGRTGSGKSTLALAILRMLPTTGSVIIDGIKTENINLHALRSNVTIIPQDPVLLSGSLRFNLDPFGDHDDLTLNDALQSSGLGASRRSDGGANTPQRLTLDYQIAAGGGNLSQGQRQLVALARALVRGSKVLILDEATASVDFETDTLIQQSIRSLPSSCTVLTVAHRLSTVMDYDKILVLGAGKVLEYDSPETLKKDENSYFRKLVQAMEG